MIKVFEENLEDQYLLGYLIERKLQGKETVLTKRKGRFNPDKDRKVECYARDYFWQKHRVLAKKNNFLWEIYKVDGVDFDYRADLKFFNLVTDLKEDGSSYGSGTNTSKRLVISEEMYEKAKKPDSVYICVVLDLLIGGKEELYFVINDLYDVLTGSDNKYAKTENGIWFNIKNYLKGINRV